MLKLETEDKLAQRVVNKVEELNEEILKKIGESIKAISTLNATQAHQLAQMLKYGGSYEEIVRSLAQISRKNVEEIREIFQAVAKENKEFAKKFYKYRNLDYIPYQNDIPLQKQIRAIADLTAGEYLNITGTTGIGYTMRDLQGRLVFLDVRQAYNEVIDRAVMNVSQGKTTFQQEMRKTMKDIGRSGLVQYESGRTRRLDSAVRMNILDGIREVNMMTSKRFGQEYGADGVEISVHENPAPDHEDIQGRQFRHEEYEVLEDGGIAKDVKGVEYDGSEKRHIGELNCYHRTFEIVVGASEPEYTDKQLEEIKKRNQDGFDFEGKHYTRYEGTQLQRSIELEVRKQKDVKILAQESGDTELAQQSEQKIRVLVAKYKELSEVSGLTERKDRMSISGYRRG